MPSSVHNASQACIDARPGIAPPYREKPTRRSSAWRCFRATASPCLHQAAIVTPDTARRHLVGDVADLEALRVAPFAALAATEEYPFGIARQHSTMTAFVHLRIIGQQQPDRKSVVYGKC